MRVAMTEICSYMLLRGRRRQQCKNKVKMKEQQREYYNRPEIKKRREQYAKDNKEHLKNYSINNVINIFANPLKN